MFSLIKCGVNHNMKKTGKEKEKSLCMLRYVQNTTLCILFVFEWLRYSTLMLMV